MKKPELALGQIANRARATAFSIAMKNSRHCSKPPREETDPAQRNELYRQIQDMFAEEVPIIPLFWEPEFITWRNGVEGVAIGAPFEFNYNVLKFADGYTPAAGTTDTIIIGTTDEVNSLDPQDSYSTHDWEILKNTGHGLLGYEPGTATLVPRDSRVRLRSQ